MSSEDDRGERGERGPKGDIGSPYQAERGERGDHGDRGNDGERGPKGDHGQHGETGATGIAGLPGADANMGRIAGVFLLFAIVTSIVVGSYFRHAIKRIDKLQRQSDIRQLLVKQEINYLGTAGCLSGRINVIRYNDFVRSAIENRNDLRKHARTINDQAAIDINNKAIKRFKGDYLPVSTIKQCNTPILK